jgi:phosphatidylserine/phosphatidylglycerophosphate/cardiolipin synthase-like enzyme
LTDVLYDLTPDDKLNLAVWRLEGKTVHSKLMIIDDEFAAIGSANFQSRSMSGIDTELHTAIIAEDDLVAKLRTDLWVHHWHLDISDQLIEPSARNLATALGLWYHEWYMPDTNLWWRLTGSHDAYRRLFRLAP